MSRAVQNGGSRGGDSGGQDLPERRRILQNQGEHMTREEIIRIVEEEEVEFIRLQFTDLFGIFKKRRGDKNRAPLPGFRGESLCGDGGLPLRRAGRH